LTLTPCRCNRSLAVLGALFASLAACALLAEDACRDGGGRVSDAAWACELASGASVSLWQFLPPAGALAAAVVVGVPAYLVVNAIGRRFITACGLPVD
jgi:hypothetical protein